MTKGRGQGRRSLSDGTAGGYSERTVRRDAVQRVHLPGSASYHSEANEPAETAPANLLFMTRTHATGV